MISNSLLQPVYLYSISGSLADPALPEAQDEDAAMDAPPLPPPHLPLEDIPPLQLPPDQPLPRIYHNLSAVGDVKAAQLFIKALEGAALDGSGLDEDSLARLKNPIQEPVDIWDDKDFPFVEDLPSRHKRIGSYILIVGIPKSDRN
ncbi:hypothetical protein R3P38DRAFT_3167931 [Favolaschia claudopus]|uniref:Uncharacterized protein n=1 Tax=Favolaschia claudopus TaxID=2862362 RepID=A0AAW0E6D3_9AGAR